MLTEKLLESLSAILAGSRFLETDGAGAILFGGSPDNPLFLSEPLRKKLIDKRAGQEFPAVIYDDPGVMWTCFQAKGEEGKYVLWGPVAITHLDRVAEHRFCRRYGVDEKGERRTPYLSMSKYLAGVQTAAAVIEELTDLDDGIIMFGNGIITNVFYDMEEEQDRKSAMMSEEENSHHTYLDEKKLAQLIRDGDTDSAYTYNKMMMEHAGAVSRTGSLQWYNMSVVAITLNTRTIIEAGISPDRAYQLSDFYIQQLRPDDSVIQLQNVVNNSLMDMVRECQKLKARQRYSNYVESCKVYIARHFREKIRVDDIAEELGISSGYLSRQFHEQEKTTIQEYIVKFRVDRAANLLRYSESSLLEIAEYVNFPSQSYFTEKFRRYKGMTPREYRSRYKPAEFEEKKTPH